MLLLLMRKAPIFKVQMQIEELKGILILQFKKRVNTH